MLGACKAVVLSPSGDVAEQQRDILLQSTALMLLIVIPVMVITIYIAWNYRESNQSARYEPEWSHSTHLELIIWSVPLLIIVCIGAITWAGTHLLDPFRPLNRISSTQPMESNLTALKVDVVALDWKWLFIYPQYGIATVNELAAPVDRPISFNITSSSVMNSFYIPALAGQIYAMPAMQTQLKAVINQRGTYEGFSANYSGAGFSGMRFTFHGLDAAEFERWVAKAKTEGTPLDRTAYLQLEKPSEDVPVRRYNNIDPSLFNAILGLCVEPGKMCMNEMASIDAKGGLGLANVNNLIPLSYDKFARRGAVFGPERSYVASICNVTDAPVEVESSSVPVLDMSKLKGAGLKAPPPFSPLRTTPSFSFNLIRQPSDS